MMQLSQTEARQVMLAAMGLSQPPQRPATKESVLDAVRRMGALQIDTIHVVARSPYLVLWSRLGDYRPLWLDEWLAEGALFEYWAHEACFLPIEDWPLYRRLMLDGVKGWSGARDWLAENRDVAEGVLDHVRVHGHARSSAFEKPEGHTGGWWNHKPAKVALEAYFNTGDLMIARRHNFQRVYDLRERVLPDWNDAAAPSVDEVQQALALKAVRALGITTARWTADYFRLPKTPTARLVERLASEGRLDRVAVVGWDESAYVHPDQRSLVEAAQAGRLVPTYTTLLSPFDPLVWDRARVSTLFGFDYRIECYTPAPQRRYGYFTLPILWRGALVGRLDPKAHRKEGLFEVKALHLEAGVAVTDELVHDLAATLRACAAWHATPQVVVRHSDPPALAERVNQSLRGDES